MVERVIGVEHGTGLFVNGVQLTHQELSPSKTLLEKIRSLPPGTSVGIEHTPELESEFEVDGLSISASGGEYWKEIQDICRARRLTIVYLEDFPTYRRYVQKAIGSEAYEQAILLRHHDFERLYPQGTTEEFEDDEEVAELLRKHYEAETKRDYIFYVEREHKMFDRIAQDDPQEVIIGMGHADYAMVKPDELLTRGVLVGEHFSEERFQVPWHWSEEAHETAREPHLRKDVKPKEDPLLFRELIRRRYRAVKQGRITNNGETPDFVGTWYPAIPAKGLFEVFIEGPLPKSESYGDGSYGIIEDTLGTSNLTITIHGDGEKITFAKNNAIYSIIF